MKTRRPTQSRSKATVRAIVEAATQLLSTEGYAATTTNRVAQKAGVSIGSLYQYFPSKQALVDAVVERRSQLTAREFTDRLLGVIDAPLESATRALVQVLLEKYRSDTALYRVLLKHVARGSGLACLEEETRGYERLVAKFLEARRAEVDVEDVTLTAYLLVAAMEGICHGIVLRRPELLDDPLLEAQLLRLVLRYCRRESASVFDAPARAATVRAVRTRA